MGFLSDTGLARVWAKMKAYVASYAVKSGNGIKAARQLTQAEYDALTYAQKMDGTMYYISDSDSTIPPATETAAGLLSAADKKKLNGIETGAQVNILTGVKGNAETVYRNGNVNLTPGNIGLGNVDNTHDTDKTVNASKKVLDTGDGAELTFSYNKDGLNTTDWLAAWYGHELRAISITVLKRLIGAATQAVNGLMSVADKKKLDGIEAGAQVNILTGVKGNAETVYRNGNVNLTPGNIGLGNVDNTHDTDKTVNASKKVLDTGDGAEITFSYNKAGLEGASWLAAWNGHELRAISIPVIKSLIGEATQTVQGLLSAADKKKLDGIEGTYARLKIVTQSQYNALPSTKYTDGVIYFIKDAG